MYVDESGDEGVTADQTKKSFYDDWFTTGGIIVEQANIVRFEQAHDSIMRNNFVNNDVKLPSSFKLHYHELRQNTYPYNSISDRQRWDIANAMFSSINSIDCCLVSATIYKPSHIAKYTWPINIRAYALLICLERFQYFLEEQGSEGTVIYERFNTRLRRKMSRDGQIARYPEFSVS